MATNLPAGPELDRLACEALTREGCAGWGPRIEWWISNDGGHSLAIGFDREEQALAYLDNPNHPHRSAGYEAVKKERFCRISQDWREAGRALGAMKKLGWGGNIVLPTESGNFGDCYAVRFWLNTGPLSGSNSLQQKLSESLPHAIALAIVAAAEGN